VFTETLFCCDAFEGRDSTASRASSSGVETDASVSLNLIASVSLMTIAVIIIADVFASAKV